MDNLFWVLAIIILVLVVFYFKPKKNSRNNNNNNSKENGPKESNKSNEYTIFVTDSFSQEDSEYMRPIFTLLLKEKGENTEVVLCRVVNGDGEIGLDQGEKMMRENIDYALKHNTYINYKGHKERSNNQKEKDVIDKLIVMIENK